MLRLISTLRAYLELRREGNDGLSGQREKIGAAKALKGDYIYSFPFFGAVLVDTQFHKLLEVNLNPR